MTIAEAPSATNWPWPFSRSQLTAGLRRHCRAQDLVVERVEHSTLPRSRPSIGRVEGLRVAHRSAAGEGVLHLVLKEPRGSTRAGLAGVGRREVGVYTSLSPLLPLATPELVAAAPNGDWLLLAALTEAGSIAAWSSNDYTAAVRGLIQLHDRFWCLEADLEAFPWLARPLETDFTVHVSAAAQAIERIVETGQPGALAASPKAMQVMARLTTQADLVVRPLLDAPPTLLHGDYWPGNIALLADQGQVVYDWQMAGVGPGVLDLVALVTKSRWMLEPPPPAPESMVRMYRQGIAEATGVSWSDAAWSMLWDHAMMWRFLEEWIDVLAASPDVLLRARAAQLEDVWIQPLSQAVLKRLPAA